MKRLTGWDAFLLYSETSNVHMHTLKIAVVELLDMGGRSFGIDEFRQVIHSRLYKLHPLRYELVDIPFKFHHPMGGRTARSTSAITYVRVRRRPPVVAGNSTTPSARSPADHWTAAGRCWRCTSSRVWPTAA